MEPKDKGEKQKLTLEKLSSYLKSKVFSYTYDETNYKFKITDVGYTYNGPVDLIQWVDLFVVVYDENGKKITKSRSGYTSVNPFDVADSFVSDLNKKLGPYFNFSYREFDVRFFPFVSKAKWNHPSNRS